jgi:signal transduction histidine kinase
MERPSTSAQHALDALFPVTVTCGADGRVTAVDDPIGLVPAGPDRERWVRELVTSAQPGGSDGGVPVAVGATDPAVDGIALPGASGTLLLLRPLSDVRGAEVAWRRLAMFEAVLATGPVLVNVLDGDFRSVWSTSMLRAELGYERVLPESREDNIAYVHPEDRHLVDLRAGDGDGVRRRIRVRAADGSWRWLMITRADLLHDPHVAGLVSHAVDVTDEVRREEEVAEGRRLLRAVIETLDEGVVVVGPEHVTFANACAARLVPGLGEPEGLIGAPAADVVARAARSMADPDRFARELRDVLADGARIEGLRLETADGRVLEHDLLLVPPSEGAAAEHVWVIRDVTAEHEADERRLQLDRLKTEFVANVSHELRTPLSALVSYLALLRDDGLQPAQREIAVKAARTADRLTRLTKDLLTYGQLEAGAVELHDEEVDVPLVLREAVADLQVTRPEGAVELEIAAGPPARTDRLRLAQIVGNLLENAVKFSPPGTPVTCGVTHLEGVWQIRVSDRGPGIPAEQLERLLRPFERGPRAARADVGGSGLGLAISSELARRLGGEVTLVPGSETGTVATLRLPIAREGS